ncbi:MAG TPA: hypothetical protein VGS21_08105 [Acidimicrobiales bacterium]|nr:hypothetical protein [Acidimicrobiales bacterium]
MSGLVGPPTKREVRAAGRSRLNRSLRIAAFLTTLATAGLVIALGAGAPDPGVAKRAYVGCLAMIALVVILQSLHRESRRSTAKSFDDLIAASEPEEDASLRQLAGIEQSIRFASTSAGDFYNRLRPLLVDIARHRLSSHGTSLVDPRDMRRVADLVSPATFEMIRPGMAPPRDRFGPGVEPELIVAAIADLERL